MFKPYRGICCGKQTGKTRYDGCGREGIIKTKRGLCEACEGIRNPPTAIPKISKKRLESHGTGQYVLFEMIANTRAHVCFVTRRIVNVYAEPGKLNVSCFAHVLSKKAWPAFELYDKNVQIMDPEIHHIYDHGNQQERKEMEKYPGWLKLMALRSELKGEYNANKAPSRGEMPW